jgi:hypothetical protein
VIYIQLISSYHSQDNGPILGPYDDIQIDHDRIRMFDGISEWADTIDKYKGEGYNDHWYYGGSLFKLFRFVNDPRKIWKRQTGGRDVFEMYSGEKADQSIEKGEN